MSDLTAIEWAVGLVSVFVLSSYVFLMYHAAKLNRYGNVVFLLSTVGTVFFVFKLLGFE